MPRALWFWTYPTILSRRGSFEQRHDRHVLDVRRRNAFEVGANAAQLRVNERVDEMQVSIEPGKQAVLDLRNRYSRPEAWCEPQNQADPGSRQTLTRLLARICGDSGAKFGGLKAGSIRLREPAPPQSSASSTGKSFPRLRCRYAHRRPGRGGA